MAGFYPFLLMTRGRQWHSRPRFAAAVNVSGEETAGLARGILERSAMLSAAWARTLVGTLTAKLIDAVDCDFVLVKA